LGADIPRNWAGAKEEQKRAVTSGKAKRIHFVMAGSAFLRSR